MRACVYEHLVYSMFLQLWLLPLLLLLFDIMNDFVDFYAIRFNATPANVAMFSASYAHFFTHNSMETVS